MPTSRRNFMRVGLAASALPALSAARVQEEPSSTPTPRPFELDEVTLDALQSGMRSGQFTSRSITEKYLARIQEIDKAGPRLNAVIEVNPEALEIADSLDKDRKEKGERGLLHGIPVLIKDNIDTADRMNTTAGSLALIGSRPPKDAFVAAHLRKAGAVILG